MRIAAPGDGIVVIGGAPVTGQARPNVVKLHIVSG